MPIAAWGSSSNTATKATPSARVSSGIAAWGVGNQPNNPTPKALATQRANQSKLQVAPAPKSKSLISKVVSGAKATGKFAYDGVVQPVINTGKAVADIGSAGGHLLTGDKVDAKKSITAAKNAYNNSIPGAVTTPITNLIKTDVVTPAKQTVAQLTGNKKAYSNAEATQRKDLTPRKLVGNTVGAALDVAAPGAGKFLENSIEKKIVGKTLFNKVVSNRAAKIAATTATGGTVNTAFGVANLAASDQPFTAKNVAKTAGSSFALGGTLGAVGGEQHANVQERSLEKQQAINNVKNVAVSSLLDKVRQSTPETKPVTKIPVNSVPSSELAKVDVSKLPDRSQPTVAPTTVAGEKPVGIPSKNDNAVATIQQHMAENYKPASTHPDETFAADHLQNNTDKALKTYQDRTTKIFGSKNIVGGDDVKYAVPGMDASKSVNYHEPSSEFAKGYYKHLLTDPDTTHKPVMITAGGTGAGKTSVLKKYFVDNGGDVNDYAAIVDTNLTNLHSATSRIEPALATGHAVHVKFVYRDPTEAFANGVIPRAVKEGRAVTAGTHAETHAGSLEAIKQIADKYKDNPKVHIEVFDNSRGNNNSKLVNLDFLHDKSYTKTEIEAKIHSLLDTQLQEGKLTNEQHTIFKGEDKPVTTKSTSTTSSKPGTSNAVGEKGNNNGRVESSGEHQAQRQPQQERPSRGVTEQKANTGTSKIAEQIAKDIKGQYGDLAQYDKLTIKDQADKAATLLSDKDRLNRVINGEEKLPEGLRATSVITAVRSDPGLLKDGELLRKLANSHLASESSYSAQELRLARENAKHDPVEAIKTVQKARQTAFERKTGKTVDKTTNAEVQAIRAAKPKVTRETWESFISSIKC